MGFILQVLFSFVIQVISNSMRLWKCIDKFVNWEAFGWGFCIITFGFEIDLLNAIAEILSLTDAEAYISTLKWVGAYCSLYVLCLIVDIKTEFTS